MFIVLGVLYKQEPELKKVIENYSSNTRDRRGESKFNAVKGRLRMFSWCSYMPRYYHIFIHDMDTFGFAIQPLLEIPECHRRRLRDSPKASSRTCQLSSSSRKHFRPPVCCPRRRGQIDHFDAGG